MNASVIGRLLPGYSIVVLAILLLLFFPIGGTFGQGLVTVEIVSKRYSSGYYFFPTVGSYVEYEIRLTNTGDITLENQSLQVSLVSDSDRTHSSAAYTIALLEPGESKNLHLGPFKMEDEGKHRLLLLLLAGSEGLTLDYPHPDSFIVYQQSTVQVIIFVAVPLVVAGSGIVGFSLYQRARRRPLPTF